MMSKKKINLNIILLFSKRERQIVKLLRDISKQRALLTGNPNEWLIEKSIDLKDYDIQSNLKTCHLRGWIEPIIDEIPIGTLEEGYSGYTSPLYRLTDSGWNVINRQRFTVLLSIIIGLLSLNRFYPRTFGNLFAKLKGTRLCKLNWISRIKPAI